MLVAILVLLVVLSAVFLYHKYEPSLDVITVGESIWIVVWYNSNTEPVERSYKKIVELQREFFDNGN